MPGKGKAKRIFFEGIGKNNPVFVQVLGICSTLAVTNRLENTVVMSIGVIFVVTFSNLVVSILRKLIPGRVRMMAETLIIASFVIIVDIVLRAYLPDIWQSLGPYVGLIITNCIIMGRSEAFAMNNPPSLSLVDGLASGIGYSYVLIIVAVFRELLGTGELWGYTIFGGWWTNWAIMVMPPGAFFMLAIFVWIIKGVLVPEEEEESK
jgi:Na+-transporting NADH:ubiquinone oxidoreductase subunit D